MFRSIRIASMRSTQAHRSRPCAVACFAMAVAVALAAGACRQQPAVDASAIPHTPIPKTDARLQVANNNGSLRYEGTVADAATKADIERSLQSVYGSDASGSLTLDPHTHAPPWAPRLGELFLAFRMPGGVLAFEGKRIELSGAVGDEDRAMLLKKARQLYPDYEFTGLLKGVDMKYALPERGDSAGLLAFLNGIPIHFQEDSGMLVPDSLDGVARAARAIRAAGVGPQVRIGVTPESAGMPEYDRNLAFQRANAVKVQLAIRDVDPGSLDALALPQGDAGNGGKVVFSLADAGAAPAPTPVPKPGDTEETGTAGDPQAPQTPATPR